MLSHQERKQLAQDLCGRMLEEYPGQIILGGVYGSTATGTDTPWSDLEMWFIVEEDCAAINQHIIFRDTAVGYWIYQWREIEKIVSNPSLKWPFHMGILETLEVLYGDKAIIHRLLEVGKSLPFEKFRMALQSILPDLVIESYGRIRSCQLRDNKLDVSVMVFEVLREMLVALCLLNRSWVRHDYYQGLVDSFAFPKLLEGYSEIVPHLYNANDFDTIVPLANKLVANFYRLLDENDLKVNNFKFVEEIHL